MKKLMALVAAVALSVVVLGAQAQTAAGKMDKMDKGGKMGKMGKMDKGGKMAASTPTTISGTVKGTPGKVFTVASATGDVRVNASKAKYRNSKSQFVSASKLTTGATVDVTGTMRGKTVEATNVKITSLMPDKPAGKMDKMDKGGKMGKMGKMSK